MKILSSENFNTKVQSLDSNIKSIISDFISFIERNSENKLISESTQLNDDIFSQRF